VSTTKYLLDANVLIALTVTDHTHFTAADKWASGKKTLICPISEGALVRFLIRAGESPYKVSEILKFIRQRSDWVPDDVSYRDVDLSDTFGHRQVTDTYLLELARHHGALLATFDEPLAKRGGSDAELIPNA